MTRLAAEAEALRAAVATLERSFATTGGLGVFSTQQTVGVGTNTQQTVGTQRGAQTARSVSAVGADVEDAELRRAALEREREALARRRERHDQELLSLERQARDLREERVRVSAQADRRAELMRELEETSAATRRRRRRRAARGRSARRGARRAHAAERERARRASRRARPRRSATTPCATCRGGR